MTRSTKSELRFYAACRLCPRRCGARRLVGEAGAYCGQDAELTVGCVALHRGEEPPIVGTGGTAAVFLSGCPLGCVFCQNHQISRLGVGRATDAASVAAELAELCGRGAQTVSFVTPDQFVPHLGVVVSLLRASGFRQPVVVNCSGYQSLEVFRLVEPWADVYLPDFKYGDRCLAASLAACPDYPGVALEALAEMVRQKDFLCIGENGVATRGVLVRHLILPGHVENSLLALRMLAAEFGVALPLSLMSQYVPPRADVPEALDRELHPVEFSQVYREARSLGFELIYLQSPRRLTARDRLPDFTRAHPFRAAVW